MPREPAWERPCVSTRARRDPWKCLATPGVSYSSDFIYTHTEVTFLFQRMRFTSCCIFLYRNVVSALVLPLSLFSSLHLPLLS